MKKKILIIMLATALVIGILSGCTEEETPTNNAPEASFTYEVNTETNNVTFDATESTDEDGDELTYSWDFGDDNTGTGATATNHYEENGTYTVVLTVSDGTDTDTATKTVEVNVVTPNGPSAEFTYEPTTVVNNTEVSFMDNSTKGDANITTWEWDFGDGTTNTTQNPTHTYTSTGNFTVTLTVTDENELTDTASGTITVEEATES